MKRLISILVITAMLLASVMAMIPAFADEIETPKAPTEGTYNVDWADLIAKNLMQSQYEDIVKGTGANAIADFDAKFNFEATSAGLKVSGSSSEERAFFSTKMFEITETTKYEFVISAKNSKPSGYCGPIFAYYDDAAYIAYGSHVNAQDSEGKVGDVVRGDSRIGIQYETYGDKWLPAGTTYSYLVLDLDEDGYSTLKVVYEGYKVTFYGLTDADTNTWAEWKGTSFTLPEGSKVCFGTFCREDGRDMSVKNASITAKNREAAAILAGASEAKIALAAALDAAYNVILTDYTDETATALTNVVNAAELTFTAETEVEADVIAATTAINDAITALVAKKADLTALIDLYAVLKYNSSTYSPIEVDKAMTEIEAAMNNKAILQSEVDAIAAKYSEFTKIEVITTAEEFANMKADGAYILKADIEIDSAYGEFKGYFNGNHHTITVKDCGVFTTLNGAIVSDLTIAGSITASTHIGALATDAMGNVAINNVVNNASITVNSSNKNVSGFIAQGKGTNITFNNCVNAADIIGGRTAGFYANSDSEYGTNNLYFYSCMNLGDISCGEGVTTNPASGFVARTTNGTTKDIVFKNCVELGDINAKYSSGAFFGCGKGNIVMTNCVVGTTDTAVVVTAEDDLYHIRPMGGVIGGANSDADSKDGAFSVVIDGCIFNVNLTVTKNYSTNPMAIVVGGAGQGTVSIKNTSVNGVLDATKASLNAYKLSSTAPTVENVFINVELKVPALPDTSKEPISGTGEGETPVYPNKEPADLTPNTDAKDFDDYTIIDARIELAKALDIVEALELADAKADALAKLGDKIAADGYTVDSYAAYEAKYAEIVAAINAATTVEKVEAIDLTAADALLVTQAAADAAALQAAKDAKLAELGDMLTNDEETYTAESYAAYKVEYEEIVASINNATDLAAVEAIDVVAAKTAAEDLLLTPDEAAALALQAAKDAKLAEIEAAKKSATVYTTESYNSYIAEVDALIASVNNAADLTAVETIDVAAAMTTAEANLVELSAEEALAALKSEALAKVEAAKKAADIYTAESYTLYIADVNALIDSINGAADRAAIEAIDVAAAMTAAEANLEEADLVAALEAAKKELVTSIPTVDYAPYTGASYREYLVAIDALKDRIEAAADMAELEAIDVDAGIAAAKAKLVTLEAQAEADAAAKAEAEAAAKAEAEAAAKKAFDDAKANALIALSAKRENAGKVFTDASYTEYSAAFDAIKAQIEGAADIAALQAIDVAALKVAAENKLAVNVPAAPEAPDADNKDDDNKNDETDKATEENKDDETEAPKDDKGCGSTPIIIIAIVVVVCGGVALFVMQKKKEN